jgi:regulator of protease activity HflC (stomatin/prohibitin superfamily)
MEWLKEIFDKILSIFPQIFIVAPFEAGVRITFGKRLRTKKAGWYVIWPLIQRFVWMEIQSQVVDLRVQSIRTQDKQEIVVSGAVQYSIKDVEKAIVNVQDVDKAIETVALGTILDFINKKTLTECQNIEDIRVEILRGLREVVKNWGIKIERVFLTDLGKSKNIRLLLNNTQI